MMSVKKIVLVAILATSAYAQGSDSISGSLSGTPGTETSSGPVPTSSGGVPACLTDCMATSTLCDASNTTCVCTNTQYQAAIQPCLQQQCSASDLAAIQALQQATCAGLSSSSLPSGSSSRISSISSVVSSHLSSISATRSSTGTGSTSTSTSGNGAAALSTGFLATAGAVLLGVIGGGALVF